MLRCMLKHEVFGPVCVPGECVCTVDRGKSQLSNRYTIYICNFQYLKEGIRQNMVQEISVRNTQIRIVKNGVILAVRMY